MDVLFSAAAFLLAIGILVAVHEYGHYIAARMLGGFRPSRGRRLA